MQDNFKFVRLCKGSQQNAQKCVKFRIVGANNGAGLLIFIVICDIMKIIMAETRPLTKKIDDKNYLEYIQTERIWKNQYGDHK